MIMLRPFACLLLAASLASAVRAEDEMLVGRTAAGQLKIVTEFPQPVPLDLSIFPGISGYAFAEPAFHSTILDDPANDLLQLSPAADFRFVLLARDPGVQVWNDSGSGFLPVGGTFFIGAAPFDNHPLWNIPGGPLGGTYALTLKLHDVNGVYADSDPLTISFAAVPEPHTASLLALTSLSLLRTRRTRCRM